MRKQTCLYSQIGLLVTFCIRSEEVLPTYLHYIHSESFIEVHLSIYNHTMPLESVFSRPWKRKKSHF